MPGHEVHRQLVRLRDLAAAAALQEQPAEVLLDLDARLELADLQAAPRRRSRRRSRRSGSAGGPGSAVDQQAHQPRQVRLQDARHPLHAAGHVEQHRHRVALGVGVAVARLAQARVPRVHFCVDAALDLALADGVVVLEGVAAGAGAATRPFVVMVVRPSCAAHSRLLGRARGLRMRLSHANYTRTFASSQHYGREMHWDAGFAPRRRGG